MKKDEFHPTTIKYIKKTPVSYRKSNGQYFTPRSIREKLLSQLPKKIKNPKIIDPACGTGEFLISAEKYFSCPQLYGWEIEKELVTIAKEIIPKAKIKLTNTLQEGIKPSYDFVIGNPPYFEFKPEKSVRKKFAQIINGRVNIFNLFIKIGLDLLKPNGYLAYVVPPSMNNGAYFAKLRDYIIQNANIEYISIVENSQLFYKAQQTIMLLVLKKVKNKSNYIFQKNGIRIFTPNSNLLKKAFKQKATLKDLGYQVKTGRLVWNQNKKLLTDNSQEGVPLIWAKNITSKGLKIPGNFEKPQYVKVNDYDKGPAIVVNRITGSIGKAKLKAALVPKGMKFIAENHVNVIFPPKQLIFSQTPENQKTLDLEEILNQLKAPQKTSLIRYITGNTQISKNELENLFPIDV